MNLAVDASALLAILLKEPDAEEYLDRLLSAGTIWISPINWWEVTVRMNSRYGELGVAAARAWMESISLIVEPVNQAQAELAYQAFARYGGRPARLNMGDCFAYALAQAKKVPLLFKGGDFGHTDLRSETRPGPAAQPAR